MSATKAIGFGLGSLIVIVVTAARSEGQDRTVYGTIRHANGAPAEGARVRIIDQDPSADDLMGEVSTGADGRYSFTWPLEDPPKIWDPPKSTHHTQWRPDILIKVKWSEENDNQWDAEAQSSVKNNCRHDQSHNINATLSAITRTVSGTVRDRNGLVPGLRVRAWDADVTGEEAMGNETTTDSNGRYSITYRSGAWDPRVPGTTSWRPDIFVTVAAKREVTAAAKRETRVGSRPPVSPVRREKWFWSRQHVSSTHNDHPLRDPLTIDVTMDGKCGLGQPVDCSLPQLVGFVAPHTALASSRHLFESACITHDYCYRHGNLTYQKSKSDCDRDFLADMEAICLSGPLLVAGGLTGGAAVTTCQAWAAEFSLAVVSFGGSSYRPKGVYCQYR